MIKKLLEWCSNPLITIAFSIVGAVAGFIIRDYVSRTYERDHQIALQVEQEASEDRKHISSKVNRIESTLADQVRKVDDFIANQEKTNERVVNDLERIYTRLDALADRLPRRYGVRFDADGGPPRWAYLSPVEADSIAKH